MSSEVSISVLAPWERSNSSDVDEDGVTEKDDSAWFDTDDSGALCDEDGEVDDDGAAEKDDSVVFDKDVRDWFDTGGSSALCGPVWLTTDICMFCGFATSCGWSQYETLTGRTLLYAVWCGKFAYCAIVCRGWWKTWYWCGWYWWLP